MAKADFENYGKSDAGDLHFKTGAGAQFNDKSGGPIDPYGDVEKKEKDAIDMNAGEAFNKKDYTKIEVMGSDYPKKQKSQVEEKAQGGYHFNTATENGSIDPYGTDAGKTQSHQTVKRS